MNSLGNLRPTTSPFEDVATIEVAGEGSFGTVYRARWNISTVALKVVKSEDPGDGVEKVKFEGALSENLAHPNLVQTYKFSTRPTPGSDAFEVWIVQEWCGLGALSAKIENYALLSHGGYPEAVEVACEIASAAMYLHGRGIIHGDITPNNVLLIERNCRKGYVSKVTDFGLARVLNTNQSCINTTSMGTVHYMPPELFVVEGYVLTRKVDVYAFGVVMWQLITGDKPFQGLQPTQVVVMVAQGHSLNIPDEVVIMPTGGERRSLGQVSAPFKSIQTACMQREPESRPTFDLIVASLMGLPELQSVIT